MVGLELVGEEDERELVVDEHVGSMVQVVEVHGAGKRKGDHTVDMHIAAAAAVLVVVEWQLVAVVDESGEEVGRRVEEVVVHSGGVILGLGRHFVSCQ